jgi:hypothetical protein
VLMLRGPQYGGKHSSNLFRCQGFVLKTTT